MNRRNTAALALAALLFAPTSLLFAQSAEVASSASQEAAKMVPATAVFVSNVDSQKLTVGAQVRVKLQSQVHLNNGPVLPGGTMLVGQVVDDTAQAGTARLALRFNQAELKGGQTLPVKVTIFNVFEMPSVSSGADQNFAGVGWDKKALGTNQANVLPGVDLHSSIDSPISGVIVATKKAQVKLDSDIALHLAIAPRSSAQTENGF